MSHTATGPNKAVVYWEGGGEREESPQLTQTKSLISKFPRGGNENLGLVAAETGESPSSLCGDVLLHSCCANSSRAFLPLGFVPQQVHLAHWSDAAPSGLHQHSPLRTCPAGCRVQGASMPRAQIARTKTKPKKKQRVKPITRCLGADRPAHFGWTLAFDSVMCRVFFFFFPRGAQSGYLH